MVDNKKTLYDNAIEGSSDQSQKTNDKYSSLEKTSYAEMLNSKIQASAAKEQALKYANNSINASGFGTQGMAESTRAGIYGNYQKAITAADETHQANLLDIQNQRLTDNEAKNTETWQSAMEMLNQAQSQKDLDYVKTNFYDGFTDEQKKYFDYYYSSYSEQLPEENNLTSYSYTSSNEIVAYDNNGGTTTTKGAFNEENKTLNNAITLGELPKDTYIALHNGNGQTVYVYYDKKGGLYYVNKATYDSADNTKVKYIDGKSKVIWSGRKN